MSVGFIILRHVNNPTTNLYWQHCYDCIRKNYPENTILIIDDDSNYAFINTKKSLYKTFIIQSEFPKRGELLPYYYYLRNKLFDTAVILHDSVFINHAIDFNVENYKLIWSFSPINEKIEDVSNIIDSFNDQDLKSFYENKTAWNGCFGGMTVIKHQFLERINEKYNLDILLNKITSRHNRQSFERVIGCLLQKVYKADDSCLFGEIHSYMPWGCRFDQREIFKDLPLVKVWTGR
jgi:hypothetical protein